MFPIGELDCKHLLASLQLGEVVLILGAGASVTSVNAAGDPVKQADALARVLAERAGLDYRGEALPIVLDAVRGHILSDSVIYRIYENEFKGVRPSVELCSLLRYVWRRIYTWYIDDAIDNIVDSRQQRQRFFNGIGDHVVGSDDPLYLQIVKLHGDIGRPDYGFIMTESEYSAALSSDKHAWYKKAAQDYFSYTPVFIGSRLSEPILKAELSRAGRDTNLVPGRAYIITPDDLSPIHSSSFQSRGIIHIRSTLNDFSN